MILDESLVVGERPSQELPAQGLDARRFQQVVLADAGEEVVHRLLGLGEALHRSGLGSPRPHQGQGGGDDPEHQRQGHQHRRGHAGAMAPNEQAGAVPGAGRHRRGRDLPQVALEVGGQVGGGAVALLAIMGDGLGHDGVELTLEAARHGVFP